MEESTSKLKPGAVAVLGIPSDVNSSFQRGASDAPARVRQILLSGSTNYCSEDGSDLEADPRFFDIGDLELGPVADFHSQVEGAIAEVLGLGAHALVLGGDHAITVPVLRAYSKRYDDLSILHLDAHPDLYDEYGGSRLSHACAFARVMEEKLAKRLVQVGIRAGTPHQTEQAGRFGVETIGIRDWRPGLKIDFEGPVYISLDMDVLDPGFAPGVSHHEPGGVTTRDVLDLIHALDAQVVGADIVELNPSRDTSDITAMAAVKFMKEIAVRMLAGERAASTD
jgi:agmatinase